MKTIIAGSRGASYKDVLAAVQACPFKDQITQVISGTARGADQHGEQIARNNGWPLLRMPANWNAHGRRAGYLRNVDMADAAEALIAVWDGESKGTKHMIDIAKAATDSLGHPRITVFVYTYVQT